MKGRHVALGLGLLLLGLGAWEVYVSVQWRAPWHGVWRPHLPRGLIAMVGGAWILTACWRVWQKHRRDLAEAAAAAAAAGPIAIYPVQPHPAGLPPSKNPRYRRIDDFVSMADIALDDPNYERHEQEIAATRARHGYPPERKGPLGRLAPP